MGGGTDPPTRLFMKGVRLSLSLSLSSPSDLLCLTYSRSKYVALTINYLLFFLLHFDRESFFLFLFFYLLRLHLFLRAEVGRNRTERERASRRPLPPHPTPRLTWEEARSRARRLYPGSEIVDKFRELKSDALFKPNTDKVVAVVQIKGAYPHLFRKGRILEVRILSMGVCVCFCLRACLSAS